MDKILMLALCCSVIAVTLAHRDLETNLVSFQDHPKQRRIEAVKDNYVKQLFSQLLGRKLSFSSRLGPKRVERQNHNIGLSRLEDPNTVGPNSAPATHEAMLLHRELQNRIGWGSNDNGGNANKNQYGPPQGFSQPNQQYGAPPPPSQQYGQPQQQPNQQYGSPQQQQQQQQNFGPPPPPQQQQQQYSPPPPPSQEYGQPQQQQQQNYGPPPPPSQEYGQPQQQQQQNYGPPPPPSQEYGQPQQPNQQYGSPPPPSNKILDSGKNNIRVNHGMFGGHIENFKLSDAIRANNNNNNNNGFNAPAKNQYESPSLNDISGYSNDNNGGDSAKIIKHVYIHTPPEEPEVPQRARVIRPNQKQDIHYQIIFVKAPSQIQQPTEIELPPQPERKTLVYLLLKKERPAEIKIRPPPTTVPSKPEVYFIRYKGDLKNGQQNGVQQDELPGIGSIKDLGEETSFNSNGGYASSYESQIPAIPSDTRPLDDHVAGIANNLIRDSVGYPNTEYRATPNMLSPNQEPMSISVYDRIRNGVMPSTNSAGGRGGSLVAASSDISARAAIRQQSSHYTAPGSKPFVRASGKMIDGQYIGMSSNVLNKQYYV